MKKIKDFILTPLGLKVVGSIILGIMALIALFCCLITFILSIILLVCIWFQDIKLIATKLIRKFKK